MNLNLSNFIEKPIHDKIQEKVLKESYELKYKEYFDTLQVYDRYFSNSTQSHLNGSPSKIATQVSTSSFLTLKENFEERKQSTMLNSDINNIDDKHEQEMIQIKLLSLINRLNKEKNSLKSQKQVIKDLNLSQNYIDLYFLKTHKQILQDVFSNLIFLDLSFNNLQDAGLEEFEKSYLPKMSLIENLNLKHNWLSSNCCGSMINIMNRVKVLDISQNSLKDTFIQSLFIDTIDNTEIKVLLIEKLIMQDCDISDRSIKLLKKTLNKMVNLKELDISHNNIDEEFIEIIKEKILYQRKQEEWKARLPSHDYNDIAVDNSDSYFQDISELLTLKYILQKTQWIVNNRVLTLNQLRLDHIFPKQNKIILKFLNLYHKSISQLQQKDDKQLQLAPIPLAQDLITAQIDVIQIFREQMLKSNVCYLDISYNNLADAYLIRGLSLLKVCSHKLTVLKLDGNVIGFQSLQSLYKVSEKLGLINIKVLSLAQCQMKCNCKIEMFTQMEVEERRKQALINKCQIEMLVRFIQLQKLKYFDVSDNYEIGQCFIQHIREDTDLKSLRTFNISGIYRDLENLKIVKEYFEIMPGIIKAEVLSQSVAYNPKVVDYVNNKILPIIKRNKIAFQKQYDIQNIDECLDLKYCVIDDNPIKNIDTLKFYSETNQTEIKIFKCINFITHEQVVLIPKYTEIIQSDSNLYLKKIGHGVFQINEQLEFYNIFENFEILLFDILANSIVFERLNKLQISSIILDFYQNFNLKNFFFHSSQMVIIFQNSNQPFSLKLLPFKSALDYKILQKDHIKKKKEENVEDDEVDFVKSTLNSFIDGTCLSKKVKIYHLLRYWRYIFSAQAIQKLKNNDYYQKKQKKFLEKLIKGMQTNEAKYSQTNMQLLIVVMTIIEDIYEMDLRIKKKHKVNNDIERSMDKQLINFYIQLIGYDSSENNIDTEGASPRSQQESGAKVDQQKCDELYLRISNLFQN